MPLKASSADIEEIFSNSAISSILLRGSAKDMRDFSAEMIRGLTSSNRPVILLTLNEPYASIRARLESINANVENIIFIDTVSQPYAQLESEGNCIFINNPSNLTDMGIALDGALNATHAKDVVLVMDSVNLLAMYNHPQEAVRFFHFMVSKIKASGKKAVFLYSGKGEKGILEGLDHFCDAIKDI